MEKIRYTEVKSVPNLTELAKDTAGIQIQGPQLQSHPQPTAPLHGRPYLVAGSVVHLFCRTDAPGKIPHVSIPLRFQLLAHFCQTNRCRVDTQCSNLHSSSYWWGGTLISDSSFLVWLCFSYSAYSYFVLSFSSWFAGVLSLIKPLFLQTLGIRHRKDFLLINIYFWEALQTRNLVIVVKAIRP